MAQTYQQQVTEGRRLVKQEGDLQSSLSDVQWRLCDLLLEIAGPVPDAYAKGGWPKKGTDEDAALQRLKQFAEDIGLALNTARQYRQFASAWPPEKRNPALTIGVHKVFTAEKDRFKLIKRKKPWGHMEAREFVAKRREERKAAKAKESTAEEADSTTAEETSEDEDDATADGEVEDDGLDLEAEEEAEETSADDEHRNALREYQNSRDDFLDAQRALIEAFEAGFQPSGDAAPYIWAALLEGVDQIEEGNKEVRDFIPEEETRKKTRQRRLKVV
jgi:hypothetical protein